MKKIIVILVWLNVNAMNIGDWEFGIDVYHDSWPKTKSKLIKLGMGKEDLDEKIPEDYSLEKLKLTNFWEKKKETSQEEKNKLLAKMLDLSYSEKFYNLQRLHIASAVMIGANPNANDKFSIGVLCYAIFKKDIKLTYFLIQNNAKIYSGYLDMPYLSNNEDLARLLLVYNTDPSDYSFPTTMERDYVFGYVSYIDRLEWYQRIQKQMQKEQEEGLKFLSAKAALNKWPSVEEIKKLQIKLPDELYDYLEETKKRLN